MIETSLNIHFSPLLPGVWLIAICAAAFTLLVLSFLQTGKAPLLRVLGIGVFLAFLMGPSLIREEREPVKDVALIVMDQSPSQDMGLRKETAQKALSYLESQLGGLKDLDVRTIHAPDGGGLRNETKLFEALDRSLADVPRQRRAGVIFVTDGQVHDVPQNFQGSDIYGPVHVLLTGEKNEKDRQLKIIQAAAYGIVGQDVTIRFIVEDTANSGADTAIMTIDTHDGQPEVFPVPVGTEQSITLPVNHAGQNIFEFKVDDLPNELTVLNNRAALIVNGVRDRLRVLLISGQPYAGARTWRDLLTSDPAVDLVHFTILREPDKIDSTPSNELSLIAFPFEELFETKLYDFDLIVFDRYRLNRILPQNYFNNIVRFVEKGGALLVTSGPSDSSDDSIYFTSLMNVLPGAPDGSILKESFKPALTDQGLKHPVTRGLNWPAQDDGSPGWGPWLRQISMQMQSGETLMSGANQKPLIILDRVKEGRVAQIASDQIWLWSRGYQGGGPHAELLRRIVHWLMKEPELDERALDVRVTNDQITVRSRDYRADEILLRMTKPDGTRDSLILKPGTDGTLEASFTASQLGVYTFEDKEGQRQFAVVGDLNPPELQGVRTTSEILKPLSDVSGGGTYWLEDIPRPALRRVDSGRLFAGYNWLGLRSNNDYTVKGVADTPLLPPWLAAIILISLTVFTWWREGKA